MDEELRDKIAQTIAANVLVKYEPVSPLNFYELSTQILSIFNQWLEEQGAVYFIEDRINGDHCEPLRLEVKNGS